MYLPPLRPFYRVAEAIVALSREVWNRLIETVETHHKAIISNRIVAFQGGKIREGPTGTILSVDTSNEFKSYKVSALPAYNSSSSQVDPWVIANPVNNSGGVLTSSNVAIGVCVPHSVGDIILAESCNYQPFGLGYNLSNGSSGIAQNISGGIPIVLQEVWDGTPSRVAVVNGSSGTCNVSIGSFATQQYDVYNNTSATT